MANLIWTLGPTYKKVSTSWLRELVYGTTTTTEEGVVDEVTLTFTVRQSIANTSCKAKIRLFKTFNFTSAYAWSERTKENTQSLYAYISETTSVPSSQYYRSSTVDSFTSNVLAEESVTLSRTNQVSNTFTITLSKSAIKETSLSAWSGKIYFGLYLEENTSEEDWTWQNYTTTTLKVSYSQESTASFSSSITLGQTSVVTINRKNDSFTHSVTWTCGKSSETLKNIETSASLTIPLGWAENFLNSTSCSGTLILTTYSGSTQIGRAQTYNITYLLANSIIPKVSSISASYSHDKNLFSNISGSSSIFTNRTTGEFIISGEGIYGSTITGYEARADSTSGTIIGQSAKFSLYGGNTNVKTIYIRVKDSRGKWSNYTSLKLTRVVYSPPSIDSLTSTRTSDSSGNTQDEITGNYGKIVCTYRGGTSPIGGENKTTCRITVNGKDYDDTTTGINSSTHSVTGFTIGLDTSLTYTVTLTDTAGSSVSKTGTLNSVNYLLHFRKNYLSLGIGCAAPAVNKQLDIAWPVNLKGGIKDLSFSSGLTQQGLLEKLGVNNYYLSLNGGTLAGNLIIYKDWPSLFFKMNATHNGITRNDEVAFIQPAVTGALGFYLISPGADIKTYEGFALPAPTRTDNYVNNILTDKYAVTVEQGGTGANNGPDALKNLGIIYNNSSTLPVYDKEKHDGRILLVPIF